VPGRRQLHRDAGSRRRPEGWRRHDTALNQSLEEVRNR
jgi:hypothetical protein